MIYIILARNIINLMYCLAHFFTKYTVWLYLGITVVNTPRTLILFIWMFGTEALLGPSITGYLFYSCYSATCHVTLWQMLITIATAATS